MSADPPRRSARHAGIEIRHQPNCPALSDGRCRCSPAYRASVFSKRENRLLRKSFSNLAEAKTWRRDAQQALSAGTLAATPAPRLTEASEAWLDGAERGLIRNRSGDTYKPSTIRGYEQALRLRVLPLLGRARLGDIQRAELQRLIDKLLADGHDPATIRNTLLPVRAIFRRAISRGEVPVNPTVGLELPAVRNRRDRVASPAEAQLLLAALERDCPLWATAFFGGLRLGELRALTWEAVDLEKGLIRVDRSWDPRVGPIAPKTRASVRSVPVPQILRRYLAERRIESGRATGLVFGRARDVPFSPASVTVRADRAWAAAGLDRITLHECRHTYASFMIAAGCNAKALCVYMGHSSVTVTFDLYGHLMPGNEAEAAGLLDAYLARSG